MSRKRLAPRRTSDSPHSPDAAPSLLPSAASPPEPREPAGSIALRVALALLTGAVAAVVVAVALAFPAGGLTTGVSAAALIVGSIVAVVAFRQTPAFAPGPPPGVFGWVLITIFSLASFRAFFWLLYPKNNEWWVLSPNNLGDMSLHIAFIRNLANGAPFWPESPILIGEPLKYPLGVDLFNSLLLRAGLPLESGLVWVGLLGAILTGVALWRWGRGFALAAFLFGGGLGGFLWLRTAITTGEYHLVEVPADAEWKNLFLTLFVTQRGLLFALPAGLLLLDHWRARYLRGERGPLPPWVAFLLYASMPLFNAHAFLFLSLTLVGVFAFARGWAPRRECLVFVGAAFVPAGLAAWLVTGGFSSGGGVHWEPWWMQKDKGGPDSMFWLGNFGLYLVLAAGALGLAVWQRSREMLAFLLPAAGLFVACMFISFAVWPWDNTKLFLWCWLAAAPAIWRLFLQPLPFAGRAIVCAVLFFTGALTLVAGLDRRHGYTMGNLGLTQRVGGSVARLPLSARFAAAPEYNHPLLLAGRSIAVGYDGHLWSHGLDYQGKQQLLTRLMQGAPDWKVAASELGVDFLFWGPQERVRYSGSSRPWAGQLPEVARGPDFTIYALKR